MFDTAKTQSIIKKKRQITSNETKVRQMKTSIGYFRDKKQSSVFSGTLSLFSFFQGQIRKFRGGRHVCKYGAVHPQSSWVTSLGRLCKRNEGNLQRKRGRKKASYLLNCSFTPDKTFRFFLSMHKSIRKTLLAYTARSFGGVQLHIIYRSRYTL